MPTPITIQIPSPISNNYANDDINLYQTAMPTTTPTPIPNNDSNTDTNRQCQHRCQMAMPTPISNGDGNDNTSTNIKQWCQHQYQMTMPMATSTPMPNNDANTNTKQRCQQRFQQWYQTTIPSILAYRPPLSRSSECPRARTLLVRAWTHICWTVAAAVFSSGMKERCQIISPVIKENQSSSTLSQLTASLV